MKKWEKEYAAVRKKEQEEMTELRVRALNCIFHLIKTVLTIISFEASPKRKSLTEKAKRTA